MTAATPSVRDPRDPSDSGRPQAPGTGRTRPDARDEGRATAGRRDTREAHDTREARDTRPDGDGPTRRHASTGRPAATRATALSMSASTAGSGMRCLSDGLR